MHPITFLCKRAHLTAVSNGRRTFRELAPMTPARFDLLYAIRRPPRPNLKRTGIGHAEWRAHRRDCLASRSLDQRLIRQRLGLARSTLSEAISKLIELGLVVKERARHGDRRRNVISITDDGIRLLDRAFLTAFDRRPVQKCFSFDHPQRRKKRRPDYLGMRARGMRKMVRRRHRSLHLRFKILEHVVQQLGDRTQPLYHYRFSPQTSLELRLIRPYDDLPPGMTRTDWNKFMAMLDNNALP